jgi:hypothetical protein
MKAALAIRIGSELAWFGFWFGVGLGKGCFLDLSYSFLSFYFLSSRFSHYTLSSLQTSLALPYSYSSLSCIKVVSLIAHLQNAGHSSSPNSRFQASPAHCYSPRRHLPGMRSPPQPAQIWHSFFGHNTNIRSHFLYRTDATRPLATELLSTTVPRMPRCVLRSLITQLMGDPSARLGRAWCRDKIAQSRHDALLSCRYSLNCN